MDVLLLKSNWNRCGGVNGVGAGRARGGEGGVQVSFFGFAFCQQQQKVKTVETVRQKDQKSGSVLINWETDVARCTKMEIKTLSNMDWDAHVKKNDLFKKKRLLGLVLYFFQNVLLAASF